MLANGRADQKWLTMVGRPNTIQNSQAGQKWPNMCAFVSTPIRWPRFLFSRPPKTPPMTLPKPSKTYKNTWKSIMTAAEIEYVFINMVQFCGEFDLKKSENHSIWPGLSNDRSIFCFGHQTFVPHEATLMYIDMSRREVLNFHCDELPSALSLEDKKIATRVAKKRLYCIKSSG